MEAPGAGAPASYQNAIVGLLAVSAGLVFLDRFGISFLFPQIRSDLGLSNTQLGSLMGITSLTWAISSIVVCAISDALGGKAKLFIVSSMIVFSLATGLIGVAGSFTTLLLLRALMGVFEGPVIPLIQSHILQVSSPSRLGTNMGAIFSVVGLLGMALPPALMTWLAGFFGWRLAFIYLTVPGLLLALMVGLLMRTDRSVLSDRRASENLREALAWLCRYDIALALFGSIATLAYGITFTSFVPLELSVMPGMSIGERTLILTLLGLVSAIGTVAAPALSDRLGRKPCLLAAAACQALVPVGIILIPVSTIFLPLTVLLQFAAGGTTTIMVFVIPGDILPAKVAATVFALLVSIGELAGGATGPTLAGLLADRFGAMSSMWFCLGLGVLTLVISLAVRRPQGTAAEPPARSCSST